MAAALSRLGTAALEFAQINGHPALIVRAGAEIDAVVAVHLADGRITGLYAVRNPGKLSGVHEETALSR
ncbi:hypothetical protein D7D52_26160 [Nocardia yunnanensis]|uniref:RNA polymerase subunit sigma-24 n=1 Tax=Nocardia yunnanensis TaxID=2382165 RepID=A0A386ZH50_9NOCA|nr:hypothetical protein [Nocardia yunnanensis]AYF76720.1 hypothetical protein D7D52_26160 [Nocardia yunnanensis]